MRGGNGTNAEKYKQMKRLVNKILTEDLVGGYVVGSMAIALHEEASSREPTAYPNDIDIAIPGEKNKPMRVPDIKYDRISFTPTDGVQEGFLTTNNGVKFEAGELSFDLMVNVGSVPGTVMMRYDDGKVTYDSSRGFKVLNTKSLKCQYEEVADGWGSSHDAKNVAETKVARLNQLIEKIEPGTDSETDSDESDPIARSLFG
jgi:hypothetical protein